MKQFGRGLQPPAWLVAEGQHRLVLMLNHVLMQEPEAQARLVRQSGRVVEARWRGFTVRLVVTPAGLLDRAASAATPDLMLTLTEDSPWNLAQGALRGDKPAVQIAGDVQFAAEINWLVDNVRWDLEEDLSRVIGDAPARAVGSAAGTLARGLRSFISPAKPGAPATGAPPPPGSVPGGPGAGAA